MSSPAQAEGALAGIAQRQFATARKGYDPHEVRAYLGELAALVERLQRSEAEQRARADAAEDRSKAEPGQLDEKRVIELLGEETARVLEVARAAAAEIRRKSEESASRLIGEASDEARRLRTEAEESASRLIGEATTEAERLRTEAEESASRLVGEATSEAERLRTEAEESAARTVREARDESNRFRAEAEAAIAAQRIELRTEVESMRREAATELDRRRAEGEALAAEMRREVEEECATLRAAAQEEGRKMVTEAQVVRERMLRDLGRRRRSAREQLERLNAARERLLVAYDVVRRTVDAATGELTVALPEAKVAGEAAMRRAQGEPEPSVEELDDLVAMARIAGLLDPRLEPSILDDDPAEETADDHQPDDAAGPTGSAGPADPAGPADGHRRDEPTEPTDPAGYRRDEPTEPTEPAGYQRAEPTEPAGYQRAEPAGPTTRYQRDEPIEPTGPSDGYQRTEPADRIARYRREEPAGTSDGYERDEPADPTNGSQRDEVDDRTARYQLDGPTGPSGGYQRTEPAAGPTDPAPGLTSGHPTVGRRAGRLVDRQELGPVDDVAATEGPAENRSGGVQPVTASSRGPLSSTLEGRERPVAAEVADDEPRVASAAGERPVGAEFADVDLNDQRKASADDARSMMGEIADVELREGAARPEGADRADETVDVVAVDVTEVTADDAVAALRELAEADELGDEDDGDDDVAPVESFGGAGDSPPSPVLWTDAVRRAAPVIDVASAEGGEELDAEELEDPLPVDAEQLALTTDEVEVVIDEVEPSHGAVPASSRPISSDGPHDPLHQHHHEFDDHDDALGGHDHELDEHDDELDEHGDELEDDDALSDDVDWDVNGDLDGDLDGDVGDDHGGDQGDGFAAATEMHPLSVDELFARLRAGRQAPAQNGADHGDAGRLADHAAASAGRTAPESDAAGVPEVGEVDDGPVPFLEGDLPHLLDPAAKAREEEQARADDAVVAAVDDHVEVEGEGDELGDPDEGLLRRRDETLVKIEQGLARRLKRVLADEQNEVLDLLRRTKQAGADELLPDAEAHREQYGAAARDELGQAARAGAQQVAGAGAGADAVVDGSTGELAAALGRAVVHPLRERIARSVVESGPDPEELTNRLRALYREWKAQRINDAVHHFAAAAYARGAYGALPEGTALRWLVDRSGDPCPDADDNALAGPVPRGEPFPTGDHCPPAHPGCRCLVVPATGSTRSTQPTRSTRVSERAVAVTASRGAGLADTGPT